MHFFFGPDMAKMCIMNPISYLNKKGIQSIIWSWIVIYPIWVVLYHVSDSTHIEMFLIYFSRYFLVLFLKHSSLYTCVYICINLLNIFFKLKLNKTCTWHRHRKFFRNFVVLIRSSELNLYHMCWTILLSLLSVLKNK